MIKFIKSFFFSNVYLGFFAMALCMETNLLVHIPLNTFPFYLLIFFFTCIYYTAIYLRSTGARHFDERTLWYRKHFLRIKALLKLSFVVVIIIVFYCALISFNRFRFFTLFQFLVLGIFPGAAAWYTYSPVILGLKKIRQTGWLKPFVVGFTWAGWVIVYPLIFSQFHKEWEGVYRSEVLLLFAQNFLFFSVNAIMFDVKDYSTDLTARLKTIPVLFSVSNTCRFVIIPLILVNLTVVFLFQAVQQFSLLQVIIQLIPYMLLIPVVATCNRQRSVLYYLAAVDGLVFIKAVCGISSILFFKK